MEKFYFNMSLATADELYKKNRTLIHDAFSVYTDDEILDYFFRNRDIDIMTGTKKVIYPD